MSASDLTEKAIKKTLFEMLKTRPFDRITVTDVVKNCGVSQSTFSYHYRDLQDLLDTSLTELFDAFIREPIDGDWKNNIKSMMEMCRDNREVVYNLLNSLPKEYLEDRVFGLTDDMIQKYISGKAEGKDIPPGRLEQVVWICRYATIGFILRFLWSDMNDDIEKTVDELSGLFYGAIDYFVENS